MMQAALTVGALPTLDESPLWLPTDIVASAVSEISLGSAGTGVMNVVNHQSFHWTRDLLPALHQAGLEFKELSQKEWFNALRKSNPDPVANPPIKLVEFFASKYNNDLRRASLTYDTSHVRSISPSLSAAPVLDQPLVDKFISHFLATSWATNKASLPKQRLIVIYGPNRSRTSSVAKGVLQACSIPLIEDNQLHAEDSTDTIVIVTFSSLNRSNRDELRKIRSIQTVFLMLEGGPEIICHRGGHQEGHSIGAETVATPDIDETDLIPIDATGDRDEVLAEVLDVLKSA
jgi:gluconate kinase